MISGKALEQCCDEEEFLFELLGNFIPTWINFLSVKIKKYIYNSIYYTNIDYPLKLGSKFKCFFNFSHNLIEDLVSDYDTNLSDLQKAVDTKDHKALKEAAHSIKGNNFLEIIFLTIMGCTMR